MTRQSGSPPGAGDKLTPETRRQGGFEDDNEKDSRGAADASPSSWILAPSSFLASQTKQRSRKKSAQLSWVFY